MTYRAVIFDWMLTLADYPPPADLLTRAAGTLDETLDAAGLAALVAGLAAADEMPDVRAAMSTVDCSVDEHRAAEMLRFEHAGLDPALAQACYLLIGDPAVHVVYPEVPSILERLAAGGTRIVVLSDIHVDLRAHAAAAGIDELIDGWVLSFEHGMQKPDPRIFALALAAAGVDAAETLMVGDRLHSDGGATALGIDTLILPVRGRDPQVPSDRLEGVVRLVG